MEYNYSFEKLDVRSDARLFIVEIYKLTKTMPPDEKFGLSSQIQRASFLLHQILPKELHVYLTKRKYDLWKLLMDH